MSAVPEDQAVEQVDQDQVDQDAEDSLAAGVMVTLLVPSQSFLPLSTAGQAKSTPDNFLELPLPLALSDAVHDLRNIITDAPEGFWLGAFSLAPYYAEEIKKDGEVAEGEEKQYGKWKKLQPPPRKEHAAGAEPDLTQWALTKEGVLGDYADLTACFGDAEFWQDKKRALKVVFTSFTNTSMHSHLLKVRDVLFSSLPPLASSPSTYDPTAFAIGAGSSLYASVTAEEQSAEKKPAKAAAAQQVQEEEEKASKGKKGKGGKKAAMAEPEPTPAPEPVAPAPDAKHAFSDWTVEDLKPENYLKHLSSAAALSATSPCLKSLGVSPWSPPPHPRRLRGDLIYLTVSTLESESFTVTGSTSGFWVSKSTASTFDPSPRAVLPKGVRAGAYQSLFELLSDLSPSFKKNLASLVAKSTRSDLSQSELFANLAVTHVFPSAPFLVRPPTHVADPFRSQAAYLITSSTTAEQLPAARDWNDEYGQFLDLPRSSVPEKLLRERLLCRQQADFVAAATRGALAVARGDIAPLNPNEPPAAYTYLHSNLLFTKAEDATGLYTDMGGSEASRYTAGKDLKGIELLEKLDVDGLSVMQTVLVDFCGERWVVQSVIPGLFKPPREGDEPAIGADDVATTTYPVGDEMAVNAADEARKNDKPYPNEETPNKEDYPPASAFRIVYGAANPEVPDEKVRSAAYFHEKLAKQVAKGMRFAEHEVKDLEGKKTKLYTASDMHGIAAPDGRSYFIDCFRLQCVDVEFREKNVDGENTYPHRLVLLRPELLEAYRESKLSKWLEEQVAIKRGELEKDQQSVEAELKEAATDADAKDGAEEKKDEPVKQTSVINADDFVLNFNPDAFVERQADLIIYDEEDESTKNVRLASQYLRDVVLGEFLAEAAANSFTVTDGFFLTKLLHRKGINMRYLGALAQKIDQEGDKVDFGKAQSKNEADYTLQLLKHTLESEMVIRAAKHLLNAQLRNASPYDHSFVVAHFFNCLLGASLNTSPVAETAAIPAGVEADRSWTELTPASIREALVKEVAARFRYELPASWVEEKLPKQKVARELALRVGAQLLARKYDFGTGVPDLSAAAAASIPAASTTPEPTTANGTSSSDAAKSKKKKKSGKAAVAATEAKVDLPPTTYTADDVLNIGPVVKATQHKSQLVDETFAHGQRAIAEGQVELGEAVTNEALHLCEQIFGAVHPEQAQKYHSLGIVWHGLASRLLGSIRQHEIGESALKELSPEDREQHLERIQELLLPDIDQARADHEAYLQQAVRMVRQSIVISERVNGVDSSDAIQQYADLGLLEHAAGNAAVGLKLSKHALDLWSAAYGAPHPALVTILNNASAMVQSVYGAEASLPLQQEYRKLAELVHGKDSVAVGQAEHALGQAYALSSDLPKALEHIKAAYAILQPLLGDEAKDVVEANQFIRLVENSVAQQAEEAKAREAAFARAQQQGAERLNKKFPQLMANAQIRGRVAGGAAGSSSAPGLANGRSAVAVGKQPEAKREHGQQAHLSVEELAKFIEGPSSSKAGRKRKPSP
ncbi:hypothetical protein JCM8547_005313 [Rhodosporidiobolus lusitaniae]